MKYVSIDIETTGLDHQENQTLEIGAVIDDFDNPLPLADLPRFQTYVRHKKIVGEPYALAMNADILRIIATNDVKAHRIMNPDEITLVMKQWLSNNGLTKNITCAGKNFSSFDKLFLSQLPGFTEYIPLHHRAFDLGSMYFDPKIHKEVIPSLIDCLRAARLTGEVDHTAIGDALTVVRLMRQKYDYGSK